MDNDRRTRAVNSGQKTPLWIVAVSVAAAVLTTMLLLMGFAWFHVPPTLANVALLGTVLAGVGTAGGLVVGLLSLYVLSDVNGRIEQKLDSSRRQSKDELQQRFRQAEDHEREMMQRLIRALSKMSMANIQSTEAAQDLVEAAIELFPGLPYAREGLGQRLAKQTFSYCWKTMADFDVPQSADPAADRRVQAIRWLEGAVAADRDKKVSLEDPDAVWWDLAKLYSLAGDHTQARRALGRVTDIEGRRVGPVDMAMLLHEVNSPDAAREVCQLVKWPVVESVSFTDRRTRWLAIRRYQTGSPGFEAVMLTVRTWTQDGAGHYEISIRGTVEDVPSEDEAQARLSNVTPLVVGNVDELYNEYQGAILRAGYARTLGTEDIFQQ